MLSTSNLSAAQAETYYTHEDYYSAEEAAHPTKWVGKGAASLGLAGIVNQQEFSQMLSGQTRVVKRRPKPFPRMQEPRSVLKAKLVA
nr:relaxase domain-containing protein [Leptolyngbya sp. KIOST-1]